jgi:hypothetical protein
MILSKEGQEISRPALLYTQTPIDWVQEGAGVSPLLLLSPTSSREVKNEWSCIFSPPTRLSGVYRDNFIFYLYFQVQIMAFQLYGGYALVMFSRTVTPSRDSVDGTRDHLTYQRLFMQ